MKVVCESYSCIEQAQDFASKYDLLFEERTDNRLYKQDKKSTDTNIVFASEGVCLVQGAGKSALKIQVDLVSGAAAHRRQFGGGKGQSISKAVGLNKNSSLHILDVTAGLGRDAFVLASLGAKVSLLERNPFVHLLLSDGLQRAKVFAEEQEDEDLLSVIRNMDLQETDSLEFLASSKESFDVVYCDPMFPERKKSALVKKEMRVFHDVVGADPDADGLLDMAMSCAKYRVVVKRPKIAPFLAESEPSYQLVGKSSRYDIYTLNAIPQ